jgi:hypothetical protein
MPRPAANPIVCFIATLLKIVWKDRFSAAVLACFAPPRKGKHRHVAGPVRAKDTPSLSARDLNVMPQSLM